MYIRLGRIYIGGMRTMLDVDDDLLAAAAAELGTKTKRDTVNAALRLVAERRNLLNEILQDPLLLGGSDLDDEDVMKGARR